MFGRLKSSMVAHSCCDSKMCSSIVYNSSSSAALIRVFLYISTSFRCTAFMGWMSTCIILIVKVTDNFLSVGFKVFLTYMIDPPPPSCWSCFVHIEKLVTMYGNFYMQMLVFGVQPSLLSQMTSTFYT